MKKDNGRRPNIVTKNGYEYYKIKRKVGKKQVDTGAWVTEYKEFYGRENGRPSKKAAVAKYEAYMRQLKSGSTLCFGELFEKWIDNVFIVDSKYKDSTKERYIAAYRKNFADSKLLGQMITDIRGADIQREYNKMTCGATTVSQLNKLLRAFFKYCEREGICQDITRSLTLPKIEHKRKDQSIDVLTDNEALTILKGFKGHRLRLLIVLALRTGARVSELLALRYDDITSEGLCINKQLYYKQGEGFKIEKTKTASAVRVIPLSDETLKEIREHEAWHKQEMFSNGYRTKYIFTTNTGGFIDKRNAQRSCDRVYDKIGTRSVSFHVYRHTFGSHLANNGTPIATVASLMGHSDVSVTSKYYINVSNDAKQAAINSIAL